MGDDLTEGVRMHVLIVRAPGQDAEALVTALHDDPHPCVLVEDGAEALRLLERTRIGLVVVGGDPLGLSGLELIARIHRTYADLPVVLVSRAGAAWQVRSIQAPAPGGPPRDPREATPGAELSALHDLVRTLLDDPERTPRPTLPPTGRPVCHPRLIGSSAAMDILRTEIELAAASSAAVVIQGESGAGKELVAQAIHARSARKGRPFVAVNVSAIPETLLENEMFGHVRGAFSGATQARRGLLVTADGGTVLLDEIGDMPLGLQAKLLRVLQLGELRAVGSDTARTVDVRVLSATHRDLSQEIAAGRFREDLFYRLNVLPIAVPPLRERSGDVPELVEHFLAQAVARTPAARVRAIGPDAMTLLRTHPWPGNVRQLAHTIERLVVFCRHEVVLPEHLTWLGRTSTTSFSVAPDPGAQFELTTLQRLTERYVSWVLAQTDDNKRRAAEILGIDLSTLYRWRNAKRDTGA